MSTIHLAFIAFFCYLSYAGLKDWEYFAFNIVISIKSISSIQMECMDNSPEGYRQSSLEHLDALYRFAMVLTKDSDEAEDLVQETYLRAMKAIDRLPANSNLKGWLFTIMRNVWINITRRASTGPDFIKLGHDLSSVQNTLAWSGNSVETPDVALMRKILGSEIREAIDRLPDQYREVMLLRHVEDFSYQEIADIIGCPTGTVMSRLNRARAQLKKFLTKSLK